MRGFRLNEVRKPYGETMTPVAVVGTIIMLAVGQWTAAAILGVTSAFELVPNERVVEIDEFETDDPSLQGEMRMTISLEDVADGTEVVGLHEGDPAWCPPR